MATTLDGITRIISTAAERAGAAVARVGGDGNGVLVADGRLVTNAHNLRGPSPSVRLGDRDLEATVLGVDPDGDLAVLGVDTAGIDPIGVAAGGVALGAPVVAVTASASGVRATFGFVSGVQRTFHGPRGRRIGGAIEHTAPLAPGSSGSALLDASGGLVGINTHRLGAGFYLALPFDDAFLGRIEALARGEEPHRPRLGVAVATSAVARRMRGAVGLEPRDGLLVREVEPGSLADRAGIAVGDLLVEAAGHALREPDDLADALEATGPDLELVCLRGTDERRLRVSLAG